MVDRHPEGPRCEWDESIVRRRLVARAWAELAGTSAPDQPEPHREKDH
jgi:hypothetical protein